MQRSIEEVAFKLVRQASTVLPPDVTEALKSACWLEEEGGKARMAFDTILKNVKLAEENSAPLCQDTGWPTFYVFHPVSWSTTRMRREIEVSVAKAVERALLRPNAVDPITGRNSGNCVGVGIPTIYFQEIEGERVKLELLLKGGGSENVSAQFSLPYAPLNAGRDLEGVRKVVLKAVYDAQGKGCSPAILGIGIGGDRAQSYNVAKRQLFRRISDSNPDPAIAELESRILSDANALGIGPMGFGGKTTALAVKIGYAHRHPASFFVSIAYFCWGSRRAFALIEPNGEYKITQ